MIIFELFNEIEIDLINKSTNFPEELDINFLNKKFFLNLFVLVNICLFLILFYFWIILDCGEEVPIILIYLNIL